MAIKNYTSGVNPLTSLGEIQAALAQLGANSIMIGYDQGLPISISFSITSTTGSRAFSMSASIDGTRRAFKRDGLKLDEAQIQRTAWRNLRDWVLAQKARIESMDEPVDQMFIQYLVIDRTGKTLYDAYSDGTFLLGEGNTGMN